MNKFYNRIHFLPSIVWLYHANHNFDRGDSRRTYSLLFHFCDRFNRHPWFGSTNSHVLQIFEGRQNTGSEYNIIILTFNSQKDNIWYNFYQEDEEKRLEVPCGNQNNSAQLQILCTVLIILFNGFICARIASGDWTWVVNSDGRFALSILLLADIFLSYFLFSCTNVLSKCLVWKSNK